MDYFEFSNFYKRDTSFAFDEDNNRLGYFDLCEGIPSEYKDIIHYIVDKIDKYIDTYDLLPTLGAPLVSKRFKDTFSDLENRQIQFFQASIKDQKGNINNNFYVLNILNLAKCMDLEKSVVEKTKYGTINIKKLIFIPGSLGDFEIVRMQEHKSYIIITEEFKKRCEDAKLKGIDFIEEGHTIYTDI